MSRKIQTTQVCKPQIVCCIGFLLIVGIGSGCGREDKSGAVASALKPIKACELLTKTDVEVIFGENVEEPEQTFQEKHEFWMSTCNYFSPAKLQTAGLLVQSSRYDDPAKAFEAHMASLKSTLGEEYDPLTIDGIGSRASWDGSVRQLTIFEGPRMFIVTTFGPEGDEGAALKTAKIIAEKVLSKLPQ
jgi:hypothetical protein